MLGQLPSAAVLAIFFALAEIRCEPIVPRNNNLEILENLTAANRMLLLKTSNLVENARKVNEEIVEERTSILVDVFHLVNREIRYASRETIFKGITEKKLLSKYYCISKTTADILSRIDSTFEKFHEVSEQKKKESVADLEHLKPFLVDVLLFVDEYKVLKEKEIKEAQDDATLKNIMNDVTVTMAMIEKFCVTLQSRVEELKYVFFEKFVDVIHATETSLKSNHKDGTKKISNCLK